MRGIFLVAAFAGVIAAYSGGGKSGQSNGPAYHALPAGLTIREEANKITLHWQGKVQAPMSRKFADAFERYEQDPRTIEISLNSPGGLIDEGRKVISHIHKAAKIRDGQIDTRVNAGSTCASMCVPIYLVGFERTAHPSAKFMFHEASFQLTPEGQRMLRNNPEAGRVIKNAVHRVTDNFFDEDFGPRSIDKKWIAEMRKKIVGRDIWLTPRQLMDQRSGVIDKIN